jgi:thioredoxin reductase (NADPH)
VKRVATAVGEGSIAVQMIHQYFAEVRHEPGGRPADARVSAGGT